MSLRINHNIASINGHRNLLKNDAAVSKSLEKLSSGLRINRAADDAAGLIISEQMRAQLTGLNQAISNSEAGVSMVQTAEGALDEMNTLLNKSRQLALHAANEGANDQNQLVADQAELDNIIDSVSRIAETTQFGTKKILDGSLNNFKSNSQYVDSAKTGTHYAENVAAGAIVKGYHSLRVTTEATKGTLTVGGTLGSGVVGSGASITAMLGTDSFQSAMSVKVNGATVSVISGQTKNDLLNSLNALGKSSGYTAVFSGSQAGGVAGSGNIILINDQYGTTSTLSFEFVSSALTGAQSISGTYAAGVDMNAALVLNTGAVGGTAGSGNLSVQLSGGKGLVLEGSGYRIEVNSKLTISGGDTVTGMYFGIIDGTSSGATFQIGANVGQTATVSLSSVRASDVGQGVSNVYTNLSSLKGSALISGNANEALKVIDDAINDVTNQRGLLGAFQANTLETNISSLRVTHENLTAAESNIRDVDFAAESAIFTKNNILIQSATAMLAQANQLPQNVLQLLQG